ncbi:MAG: hypothetical protein AAF515_05165 [Pseudomonadota bacterium]
MSIEKLHRPGRCLIIRCDNHPEVIGSTVTVVAQGMRAQINGEWLLTQQITLPASHPFLEAYIESTDHSKWLPAMPVRCLMPIDPDGLPSDTVVDETLSATPGDEIPLLTDQLQPEAETA